MSRTDFLSLDKRQAIGYDSRSKPGWGSRPTGNRRWPSSASPKAASRTASEMKSLQRVRLRTGQEVLDLRMKHRKNSSRLNERRGNVYENKGSL